MLQGIQRRRGPVALEFVEHLLKDQGGMSSTLCDVSFIRLLTHCRSV
jgi:hypothetical protein